MRTRIACSAASIVTLLVASAVAHAQSDAFPFGDPKLGKRVLEERCSTCHVQRWGGDGSGVFRRADRKISNARSLLAWVQRCNAGQKTGLSTEEEQSVAAYLNEAYYKFK